MRTEKPNDGTKPEIDKLTLSIIFPDYNKTIRVVSGKCEEEKANNEAHWERYANRPYFKIPKEDWIRGCGIYAMVWENAPYFYIGKSKDLKLRMSTHLSRLRIEDHDSVKVLMAYMRYGLPKFKVLWYCDDRLLGTFENEFLKLNASNKFMLNSQLPYNPSLVELAPFNIPVITNIPCELCTDISFKKIIQ